MKFKAEDFKNLKKEELQIVFAFLIKNNLVKEMLVATFLKTSIFILIIIFLTKKNFASEEIGVFLKSILNSIKNKTIKNKRNYDSDILKQLPIIHSEVVESLQKVTSNVYLIKNDLEILKKKIVVIYSNTETEAERFERYFQEALAENLAKEKQKKK